MVSPAHMCWRYHSIPLSQRCVCCVMWSMCRYNSLLSQHGGYWCSFAASIMTSSNGIIFRVTSYLWGESTCEFPSQRPVARSFGVFFDLRLNNGWATRRRWFETPSHSLWRHYNEGWPYTYTWWRHDMEIFFFSFLALCEGIAAVAHDDVIKWNIFRVTGHLCGEFTGYRWLPRTKTSDAELWCFLWSASE